MKVEEKGKIRIQPSLFVEKMLPGLCVFVPRAN